MTEGDLAHLLRWIGLQVVALHPEREVSVAEAKSILKNLSALFRPLAPAAFTLARAPAPLDLGNPAPAPLSPSTP